MKDMRLLRVYGSMIDPRLKLKLSQIIIYFYNMIVWERFSEPLSAPIYNTKNFNFFTTRSGQLFVVIAMLK